MENTQITLTITAKQVNIILAHLSEGKFKDVNELMNLITSQGNAQIAALQKPIDEKPETPPASIEPLETETKQEVMN